MAYMPAFLAFYDVFLSALSSFMTNLIALEAYFFIAFEGIMGVFSTKNTAFMLGFIWTVLLHMANLAAIMAFNSWILLSPISLASELFHIVESIFIFGSHFISIDSRIVNPWEWNLTIRFLSIILFWFWLFFFIFFVPWFILFFCRLLFLFILITELAKIFISPHKLRLNFSFPRNLHFQDINTLSVIIN